ncbi:hypothetical protein [Marinactinospora rubrisoli]|uniref:DUF4386 domain-containing protein n=1 Tax=Marinactinospora rubrisoli TaxID=2715399 RepID=A0ABW2KAS4_9ACTN
MRFSRTGGVAAIGFATAIVLANVLMVPAGLPHTGADPAEAAAFFGSHGGIVGLGSALTPAAWVLATVFGAAAVGALRPSERDRGEAWSLVGFAGLLLQNTTFAAVAAVRLALTQEAMAAPVLWALHDTLFTLNGTFLALALLGLSAGGLRAGLLRPWHGGLGLLSALLLFASATLAPLVVEHGGPLGLLGLTGWLMWVVWVVGYGIVLLRLPTAARSRAAAGPA